MQHDPWLIKWSLVGLAGALALYRALARESFTVAVLGLVPWTKIETKNNWWFYAGLGTVATALLLVNSTLQLWLLLISQLFFTTLRVVVIRGSSLLLGRLRSANWRWHFTQLGRSYILLFALHFLCSALGWTWEPWLFTALVAVVHIGSVFLFGQTHFNWNRPESVYMVLYLCAFETIPLTIIGTSLG